eukprot:3964517-Pyramimonas_sp.AAC.1
MFPAARDASVGARWHGQEKGIYFRVDWRLCASGAKPKKTTRGAAGAADMVKRSSGERCPEGSEDARARTARLRSKTAAVAARVHRAAPASLAPV